MWPMEGRELVPWGYETVTGSEAPNFRVRWGPRDHLIQSPHFVNEKSDQRGAGDLPWDFPGSEDLQSSKEQFQTWRREDSQQSEKVSCLSLGQGNWRPFYQVDDLLTSFLNLRASSGFLWLTGSSKTHRCPFSEWISQANTTMLFVSQLLCCVGREWGLHSCSARDSSAKPLTYSAGTAGHPSCNRNTSLWPQASNLLLNPHFKESYDTRVRLNQTKLQCLYTVAHFQISLYLTTSPSETQLGAEQNDPMII